MGQGISHIEQDRDWHTDQEGEVVAPWRGIPKGIKWYRQVISNGFEDH